jgi:hypothetical protein
VVLLMLRLYLISPMLPLVPIVALGIVIHFLILSNKNSALLERRRLDAATEPTVKKSSLPNPDRDRTESSTSHQEQQLPQENHGQVQMIEDGKDQSHENDSIREIVWEEEYEDDFNFNEDEEGEIEWEQDEEETSFIWEAVTPYLKRHSVGSAAAAPAAASSSSAYSLDEHKSHWEEKNNHSSLSSGSVAGSSSGAGSGSGSGSGRIVWESESDDVYAEEDVDSSQCQSRSQQSQSQCQSQSLQSIESQRVVWLEDDIREAELNEQQDEYGY